MITILLLLYYCEIVVTRLLVPISSAFPTASLTLFLLFPSLHALPRRIE